METTTSCQIQGIKKSVWLRFRQMALSEGVSATGKVRAMIEETVASNHNSALNQAPVHVDYGIKSKQEGIINEG